MSAESEAAENIKVTIGGKSYDINCPPEKTTALQQAAEHLDEKMREIRDTHGNSLPSERIAIITALNMSYDLIKQQQQIESSLSAMADCMQQDTETA
jgi:cell division protein ZapA